MWKSLHTRDFDESTEKERQRGEVKERTMWKLRLAKSLKIAAAALTAIALAGELGLKYSSTAGIITILSIQNTKQETLKSAGKRWIAFVCALVLAGLCFSMMDYSLWAFGLFLFFFVLLCLWVGWGEAIAMNAVLATHFLAEQSMEPAMLVNEALLLLIGTGTGILVNLHLRRRETEFRRLAEKVDDQMKGILQRMSRWLPESDRCEYGADCFVELKAAIDEAKNCALVNYGNTVFSKSTDEIDYIAMREKQSYLLWEIYENITKIQYLPGQSGQVAEMLGHIGDDFHRDNTVEGLLDSLDELFMQMKEQELPRSREEFEARAILFYILMQIRQFLEIKREYVMGNR